MSGLKLSEYIDKMAADGILPADLGENYETDYPRGPSELYIASSSLADQAASGSGFFDPENLAQLSLAGLQELQAEMKQVGGFLQENKGSVSQVMADGKDAAQDVHAKYATPDRGLPSYNDVIGMKMMKEDFIDGNLSPEVTVAQINLVAVEYVENADAAIAPVLQAKLELDELAVDTATQMQAVTEILNIAPDASVDAMNAILENVDVDDLDEFRGMLQGKLEALEASGEIDADTRTLLEEVANSGVAELADTGVPDVAPLVDNPDTPEVETTGPIQTLSLQ